MLTQTYEAFSFDTLASPSAKRLFQQEWRCSPSLLEITDAVANALEISWWCS
jgi:hypothetical protein